MQTQQLTIPLAHVVVGDRMRRDLGDISDLADSLAEHGLIQPIVIDQYNRLVAGGRRFAAATHLGWSEIPYVQRDTLSDMQLRQLELEENVKRKDFDWRERALALREIHVLAERSAYLSGVERAPKSQVWNMEKSAATIGMQRMTFSQDVLLGTTLLREPRDTELWACPSRQDAMRLLLARKEKEAKALVSASAAIAPLSNTAPPLASATAPSPDGGAEPAAPVTHLNLALYAHPEKDCNSIGWLASLPDACVDHIITDPPYGIDMANLQQSGTGMDVSRTAAEHGVEDNVALLYTFIGHAARVVRDKGFVVLWCDQDWWGQLTTWATMAGLTPCRWPLVWCKPPGAAMNQAAGHNPTKATEFALVLRKGNATLARHMPCNWLVARADADDALFDHPFAKPFECWRWLVESFTLPGQLLLDPFAGSGSAPCAFIRLHRKWLAAECMPEHFQELLRNTAKTYARTFPTTKFEFLYDRADSAPT